MGNVTKLTLRVKKHVENKIKTENILRHLVNNDKILRWRFAQADSSHIHLLSCVAFSAIAIPGIKLDRAQQLSFVEL